MHNTFTNISDAKIKSRANKNLLNQQGQVGVARVGLAKFARLHHTCSIIIMDAVGSEEGELVSNGVAKENPELEELISLDQSVDFDLKDMSESEARPDSVAEGDGHEQTSEQENSSCQQLRMCCASPRLTAMRQFWFVKEAVHLTRLAVPLVSRKVVKYYYLKISNYVLSLCQSLLGFMQQLFFFIILPMVGHRLGPTELDAVGE